MIPSHPLPTFRSTSGAIGVLSVLLTLAAPAVPDAAPATSRPNILLAISDDQSYPHASAYGCRSVNTPGFDRVAAAGALFTQAFAPTPGCSPTRAALLTGRHAWQIGAAGTHASSFPAEYETFPDRLEGAGYTIGGTGKLWGPGNFRISGRERNPGGPSTTEARLTPPARGISNLDYARNFDLFLDAAPGDRPFFFWYGAQEPHRSFEAGYGRRTGKDPATVDVPGFLPDHPEVREDMLDYFAEIEWFDRHLATMLDSLARRGLLENTLVLVTSDNGMAFPRAKANLYEHGIHMPLAIAWPAGFPGARRIDDLVGFVDLTATIYDLARVEPPRGIAGRSLRPLLESGASGIVDPTRDAVFSARERHSSSRFRSLGYPSRAIRTHDHLLIRNFHPERWPAGTPQKLTGGNGGFPDRLGPEHGGYHDIDACPTLDFLIANADHPHLGRFLDLAVARRPAIELYDIRSDPACLVNLADNPGHRKTRDRLRARLDAFLLQENDPRALGFGDVFETYPRYSPLRWFPTPDWARDHPERIPAQPWIDAAEKALRR